MPCVEELYILAMVDKNPRTPLLQRSDFYSGTYFTVRDVVDVGCDHNVVLVDFARKAPGASNQGNKVRPALRYKLPNHSGCLQISCIRWWSDQINPISMRFMLELWIEVFSFSGRVG